MPEELPQGYYLDNFHALLDFVRQQYADLLTDAERDYADRFAALPRAARCLYVRLISRRGPLFRSDKLNYPEIGDMAGAWETLRDAGYLDFAGDAGFGEVVALLTRADLVECLAGNDRAVRSLTRNELVELAEESFTCEALRERLAFEVLRPLRTEDLALYQLLFFGNLNQDLTEFVLTDLGLLTYEDYPIHRSARAFESRDVVDRVIRLRELGERLEAVVTGEAEETLGEILREVPDANEDEMVRRRTARLLNRIGRQLEREGALEGALTAYARADAPPARERTCRILERTGRWQQAFDLAVEMRAAPLDEEEMELARRFIPRLQKRLGHPRVAREAPRLRAEDISILLRIPSRPGIRVEECARDYLTDRGTRAFYVENHLFLGLFGLTFWEAIFEPVRGAFFNRFQSAPADLYSPRFRAVRAEIIARLTEEVVDDDRWRARVRAAHASKFGIANPFVHWQTLTPALLDLALERIPGPHALHVFDRLLWDLRGHRSGFPDLIVFPEETGYLLVEVKGPGDRLQENQKRWMRAFEAAAIPFQLANVEWE